MFTDIKFLGNTRTLLTDKCKWHGAIVLHQPNLGDDLASIRNWANKEGMVTDSDQFITDETVNEIAAVFSDDDGLAVAVHITSSGQQDGFMYLEYPLVPVKALIKHGLVVEIVHWSITPGNPMVDSKVFRDSLRFGFWIAGGGIEFVSVCWSGLVWRKFDKALKQLAPRYGTTALGEFGYKSGEVEIVVNGDVTARFFRNGMAYDAHLEFVGSNARVGVQRPESPET